jgi:hypothetical protein
MQTLKRIKYMNKAQVTEHLPTKSKVWSSNPSTVHTHIYTLLYTYKHIQIKQHDPANKCQTHIHMRVCVCVCVNVDRKNLKEYMSNSGEKD